MADTSNGDARAQGRQDDSPARVEVHLDNTYDSAVLSVFQTAEWIPPAYRQAYLDGAASVLGYDAVVEN